MKNHLFLPLLIIAFSASVGAKTENTTDIINPSIVELQLQAEQWVKTNTALVTISADITLDKNNSFLQTREQLLQKLNNLAEKTTWNITAFNTFQSDSGLEQIHVEAQARLQETILGTLREKTKSLSKPGLTLRVVSTDFTPSLDELEIAKANLRSVIYNEAKQETDRINKIYPEQNYLLHSITFQPTQPMPIPFNAMLARATADGVGAGAAGGSYKNTAADTSILAVSTKMQLTATVDLSSSTSKEITKNQP